MKRLNLLAATAIILASCATTVTTLELLIPGKPVLPTIQASELSCLSQETYEKLVERDVKQSAHIDRIHEIIDRVNK